MRMYTEFHVSAVSRSSAQARRSGEPGRGSFRGPSPKAAARRGRSSCPTRVSNWSKVTLYSAQVPPPDIEVGHHGLHPVQRFWRRWRRGSAAASNSSHRARKCAAEVGGQKAEDAGRRPLFGGLRWRRWHGRCHWRNGSARRPRRFPPDHAASSMRMTRSMETPGGRVIGQDQGVKGEVPASVRRSFRGGEPSQRVVARRTDFSRSASFRKANC